MGLVNIWRRIQGHLRSWAKWEVAKSLFVKPTFSAVVAHPYRSALFLGFLFYFFVAGIILHLRWLFETAFVFLASRETQRLVHDVCQNISTLVEKVSSFQNVARLEELLGKCDLMNVKLNFILLISGLTCLTFLLWLIFHHFPSENDAGSPKKEALMPLNAATDMNHGDDVCMSDAGLPTNQQPSA